MLAQRVEQQFFHPLPNTESELFTEHIKGGWLHFLCISLRCSHTNLYAKRR